MRARLPGKNLIIVCLLSGAALISLFGMNPVFDLLPVSASPIRSIEESKQLVLILGKSWTSSSGTLYRFERSGSGERWKETSPSFPVSMGMNGFAWGIGLHSKQELPGPTLDEGDRRTPAGAFAISSLFGHLPIETLGQPLLSYRQLTESDICVDDPASIHYNQIISTKENIKSDWRSAEPMKAQGDAGYRLGVVFDQNPAPSLSRRGSCIFLHIGPDQGSTFGCTTLNETRLREIVTWLDGAKKPVLIQLPEPVFVQVRKLWDLPELSTQ